ncbi:MAG: YkvA family protein [Ruminiclostridium sp.]
MSNEDCDVNISEVKIKEALNSHKEEAKRIISDSNKTKEFIDKIVDKLGNIPIIGPYFEDIPLLCTLVYDYVTGKYKEVPLASIITIVAALAYFLSPIDLIPDPIPVIGYVDDAAVIGLAIMAVHNDLQSYKQWKNGNE